MNNIIHELQQRKVIFGTPVRFLTHEKMYRDFEPPRADGKSVSLDDAVVKFGDYLAAEFKGIDFFMPPPLFLAMNYRKASGEGPVCIPLLSEEQVKDRHETKPIGAVICPGGENNVGVQFLANFTKAPGDTYGGFSASNQQWKLMQICHEVGHVAGADELKADIAGMITYHALTKDTDFLLEWYNARLLKSLFNPDGAMDIKAAVGAVILKSRLKKGLDHLSLDDQSIPNLCEEIIPQIEVDEKAFAEFKTKVLSRIGNSRQQSTLENLTSVISEIMDDETVSLAEKKIGAYYLLSMASMEQNMEAQRSRRR